MRRHYEMVEDIVHLHRWSYKLTPGQVPEKQSFCNWYFEGGFSGETHNGWQKMERAETENNHRHLVCSPGYVWVCQEPWDVCGAGLASPWGRGLGYLNVSWLWAMGLSWVEGSITSCASQGGDQSGWGQLSGKGCSEWLAHCTLQPKAWRHGVTGSVTEVSAGRQSHHHRIHWFMVKRQHMSVWSKVQKAINKINQ